MDPHLSLCGNIAQILPWTRVGAEATSEDVHPPLFIAHRHEQGFRLQQTADIHIVFGGNSGPGFGEAPVSLRPWNQTRFTAVARTRSSLCSQEAEQAADISMFPGGGG